MGKNSQRNKTLISSILCFLIRCYQRILSPFLPMSCRFYPSCSCYCIEAITAYGMIKGLYLGLKRILRCHPWSKGGYDPI